MAGLKVEFVGGVCRLAGDLDHNGVAELRRRLDGVTAERLVLDLTGVEFIDSTGLGALVGLHKRRPVHVRSASDACHRMFDRTRASAILSIG